MSLHESNKFINFALLIKLEIMRNIFRPIWESLVARTVSEALKSVKFEYLDSSVIQLEPMWGSYEAFERWCKLHHSEGYIFNQSLFGGGSNVYSPSTCCFIPVELDHALKTPPARRRRSDDGLSKPIAGVTIDKRTGLWRADIGFGGRSECVGFKFSDQRSAERACCEAREAKLVKLAEALYKLKAIDADTLQAVRMFRYPRTLK